MHPVYNDFLGDDRSVLFGDGDPIAHIDSMCFSSTCEDATDGRDVQNFDFCASPDSDGRHRMSVTIGSG
ncbi:hypothetical protein [Streptomyces fungicidicus]